MSEANITGLHRNEPGGSPLRGAGWIPLRIPGARTGPGASEPPDEVRDGGWCLPSPPDPSMLVELDVTSELMEHPDPGEYRIIAGWQNGATDGGWPAIAEIGHDIEGRVALFARLLDDTGPSVISWPEAHQRNLWPEWRHLGCLCVCLEVLPPMPWLLPNSAPNALSGMEGADTPQQRYVCFVSVQFFDGFRTVVRRDELIM